MGRPRKSKSRKQTEVDSEPDKTRYTSKAINTWDDIGNNSEDEFHEQRQKISIDSEPTYHDSDEQDDEVFGLDLPSESEESSDEEDAEPGDDFDLKAWGRSRKNFYNADDTFADEEAAKEEEEEALRLQKERLKSMKEADFMEDEEADDSFGARLAQTKPTTKSAMSMERQLMDALNAEIDSISFGDDDKTEIITKQIKTNLSKAEMLDILDSQSPELLELIVEFQERFEELKDGITPLFHIAKKTESPDSKVTQYLRTKYYTILNYLLNISFYFVLHTLTLSKSSIQSHPVIDTLVRLREVLEKIEKIEEKQTWLMDEISKLVEVMEQLEDMHEAGEIDMDEVIYGKGELNGNDMDEESEGSSALNSDVEEELSDTQMEKAIAADAKSKKRSAAESIALVDEPKKKKQKKQKKVKFNQEVEYEAEFKKLKKKAIASDGRNKTENDFNDDDLPSDDEPSNPDQTARSLRKVVQRISQQAAKKQAKRNGISGDDDVPYRDRRNDFKLNADKSKSEIEQMEKDAERFSDGEEENENGNDEINGDISDIVGDLLDDEEYDDFEDGIGDINPKSKSSKKPKPHGSSSKSSKLSSTSTDPDFDPLSYYNTFANAASNRSASKSKTAYLEAKSSAYYDTLEEPEEMDGKREINYAILKNKGLTPKRKKEQRNPRVKHRNKYNKKMKKLSSFKSVVKGQEGSYAGELTGIKIGVSKSVRLG
ncbi:Sas10 C-terminal domain-containing protein [Paraphysoderma sedebokerense]|nr:Sas10 C-terminal domain-containing protein [Paraphysoderma sedebokerense]